MTSHGIVPRKTCVIVAIDFGSHGTGFAYSLDGTPAAELFHDYPDAPLKYPKTLSAILYDNRQAVSIGWTAKKEFLRIRDRAAPGQPPSSHRLITSFKLLLHDPSDPLVPQLPPGINEVQVVADFLSQFKKLVMSALRAKLGPGRSSLLCNDSLNFVVTVPSMWSDRAKSLMRDACIRAGLVRREQPDQLIMALEPESAALWAKQARVTTFDFRDLVMVLDAGGGTVDWTVHRPMRRDGEVVLAEATATHGELLGSLQLDKAFLEHFRREVGEEAFDGWKPGHEVELQQLLGQWENLKSLHGPGRLDLVLRGPVPVNSPLIPEHQLVATASLGHEKSVSIPPALYAAMSSSNKSRLRAKQGRDDSVSLGQEVMRSIFDPTIDKIIASTKEQMRRVEGGAVNKVLLVGGFSSSPYLQQRVKNELTKHSSRRPQVPTVQQPYAAVLRGAVLFGCNPSLIRLRKARYAYGIRTTGPYVEGSPTKEWHREKQMWCSHSLFARFVEKGQSVEYNETVHHEFVPLYSFQTEVDMDVYIIDTVGARFADDADTNSKKVDQAHLHVSFDKSSNSSDRVIDVAFRFGRAEITVTATDLHSHRSLDTTIKFATG